MTRLTTLSVLVLIAFGVGACGTLQPYDYENQQPETVEARKAREAARERSDVGQVLTCQSSTKVPGSAC